ncbi:MAG: hypothetical protein LAT56_00300 [Wenzhouxiangella sp.]|nr:hypothetical protein [Wenzhouxiangella sp.]
MQIEYRKALIADPYYIQSIMSEEEYGPEWHKIIAKAVAENEERTLTFIDPMNRVVGIGGIVPVRRGCEEAWTVLDERAKDLLMTPVVWKEALDMLQSKFKVRRLQAMARDTYMPMLAGWHERLGFEYECTLKEYDRGDDHHVYVRFGPWV